MLRDLLARAYEYANLTPGERAFLRTAEYLLASAILAGVVAALQFLTTQDVSKVNWSAVLGAFVSAGVIALYAGVSKYLKAFTDPALPPPPPSDATTSGNSGA